MTRNNMILRVCKDGRTYDFDVYEENGSNDSLAAVMYDFKENKFYRIRKTNKNLENLDDKQKNYLEKLRMHVENGTCMEDEDIINILDMLNVETIGELESYSDESYIEKELAAQELLENLIIRNIARSIYNDPNSLIGETKPYAEDIIKRILKEMGIVITIPEEENKINEDIELIKKYTRNQKISKKERKSLNI